MDIREHTTTILPEVVVHMVCLCS